MGLNFLFQEIVNSSINWFIFIRWYFIWETLLRPAEGSSLAKPEVPTILPGSHWTVGTELLSNLSLKTACCLFSPEREHLRCSQVQCSHILTRALLCEGSFPYWYLSFQRFPGGFQMMFLYHHPYSLFSSTVDSVMTCNRNQDYSHVMGSPVKKGRDIPLFLYSFIKMRFLNSHCSRHILTAPLKYPLTCRRGTSESIFINGPSGLGQVWTADTR